MWDALILQSPAMLSFAALLESLALHLHEPSHAMRSIIVYSPECVEGDFSEGRIRHPA
jgi:hypothetical protein